MKRARSLSDISNDHSELVWTQDRKCWSDEDNPDKPLIAPIWVKSKKLRKSLSVNHKQDVITAQKNGNWEEVKKLLNHDPTLLNATDILTGKSLLMYEIQNIDHFRYLIQLRANVNIFDKSGINVLHLAVQENVSVEILKILIEDCNMDPNAIDARAETALFHSLMNPKRIVILENIKYLLSKGANVNFQNRHGYSPLLMACFGFADNHELVKLFLDAGADVLATETKFHRTALMLAIECPYFWTNSTIDRDPIMTTVQHLVQAGADIFAVDKFRNTSFNFLINHYMDMELDPNSSYQNYINLLGKRIVIMALFDYLLESSSQKLEQNCIPGHIMTHIQNTLLTRFNAIHYTDLSCFAEILLYMPNKLATKIEIHPLTPTPLNPCTLDWERYAVSPLLQKCGHHFSYHKTMTCVYIDTIGLFICKYARNIDKLDKWLDKLLDNGYTMRHPNQEVVSPMTALISSAMISQSHIDKFKKVNGVYRDREPKIMSIFRIMLQNNVDISQKLILNHLVHSQLRKYCTDAYMTDALWMIALWGKQK
jgi:ankyrin repeat protein